MKQKSGTSRKKAQYDIFQVLKKDHRLVESLFKKIEKANSASACEETYLKLRTELTHHAAAEEKILYPRLKEDETTRTLAFEAVEEHDVVKNLMEKIDGLEPGSEEWDAAVCVLKEVVEHHVEEEEGPIFSKMRRAFSKAQREEMYFEFEARKENLGETLKQLVA